jgi:hypothetical protein
MSGWGQQRRSCAVRRMVLPYVPLAGKNGTALDRHGRLPTRPAILSRKRRRKIGLSGEQARPLHIGSAFDQRADAMARWKAQLLAEIGERCPAKIRKVDERLVRYLTHFANGFQVGCFERALDPGGKYHVFDRRIVRQLGTGSYQWRHACLPGQALLAEAHAVCMEVRLRLAVCYRLLRRVGSGVVPSLSQPRKLRFQRKIPVTGVPAATCTTSSTISKKAPAASSRSVRADATSPPMSANRC